MQINPWLVDTGTPPIPEARAWAAAYAGDRGPAIDLSQAVPADPPPPALLEVLATAAGDPASAQYGPIFGDAPLRDAYADHVSTLYGAPVAASEVAITMGCNQAFVVAILALARAGESIILPAPWYFNHAMTLQMMGIAARPLLCRPEAGFVPDVADAAGLVDASTRAIVLVTPNNPTGAVYPPETIAAFAALCHDRGLALILDETYRDFRTAMAPPHALFAESAWRETLIGLYSFSKSYAIPGHRLGAITAGPRLMGEIGKVLDCLQICPARVGQAGVTWAIPALAPWREKNRRRITERAAHFRAMMQRAPGWQVGSVGAYFAYVAHPFPDVPAPRVARALASGRGVLALPGDYFGPAQATHLRIAFANAGEEALSALPERLEGLAP